MKKHLLLLALIITALLATGQKLRRKNLKAIPRVTTQTNAVDTLDQTTVRITGYDKPLRARRETMIVTNLSDQPFDSLLLKINYTDKQGNPLHTRTLTIPAHILPGQAQNIAIKTWDPNNTYYYFLSPPTRSSGTPYALSIKAFPIIIKK